MTDQVSDQEQDRELGRARSQQLIRGISSSVVARAVTALSPFLLIPITLRYLGAERYGVWMAITSITSMFLWADLGLGNGLLTKLSPLVARGSWDEGRVVVTTAYVILGMISAVGVTASIVSYWLVPWPTLLNADGEADPAAVAVICLAFFALNIPAALVHRMLFALQRVPSSNNVQLISAALTVSAATTGVRFSLPANMLILLVVSAPVVTNVGATLWFFVRVPNLRPLLASMSSHSRSLVTTGLLFFMVSVLTSVALNIDNLVVAHADSITAVASYSVGYRIFAVLAMLLTIVNMPLWPANADALARGDLEWVQQITRRMVIFSGVGVLCTGTLLALIIDPLLNAVAGDTVELSSTLVIGFILLWTTVAMTSPFFMVQNSIGLLGPQLVGWSVYLIVSIPAKIAVASEASVEWIPVVGVVIYLTTVTPSALVGYRRALVASKFNSRTYHGGPSVADLVVGGARGE